MISEAEYANLRRKIVVSALVSTKICEWGTPEELISNEKIKKMTKNIEKKLKNISLLLLTLILTVLSQYSRRWLWMTKGDC